jgi:hypothetical protein
MTAFGTNGISVANGAGVSVGKGCDVAVGEPVEVRTTTVTSTGLQPAAKIKIICDRKKAGLQIRDNILAMFIFSPLVSELFARIFKCASCDRNSRPDHHRNGKLPEPSPRALIHDALAAGTLHS